MSRISTVKKLIKQYEESFSLAQSLFNISMMKKIHYTKLSQQAEKKFNFLLELTKYYKVNLDGEISIIFGSEMGFCGGFNNIYKELNENSYYIVGKKAQNTIKNQLGAFHNIILDKQNLKCALNDGHKVKFINLKDIIYEPIDQYLNVDNHLNEQFTNILVKSFYEYIESKSMENENKHRIAAMSSAKDNTQEAINTLKIEYNKLRQQNITNEILLMNSLNT